MIITRITGSTDTQIEAISPIVVTTLSTGVVGDRGPQGNPGSPGINGREVELRNSGTAIEWKFVGEAYWRLLVPLDTLQGSQGEPGIQGIPGIQGTSGPQGPSGPTGPTGADGRDIELQTSATHLEWRYVGDSIWNPVIALSALVGPQGVKGDKGDTGNVGPQGPIGLTGATGLKGDKGDPGDIGPQGEQGIQGPAGVDGASAIVTPPVGFGWNFANYPITIFRQGRNFYTDFSPEKYIDPLCFSGVCYHVDFATGIDTNTGTGTYDGDFSAPVKSIHKAITLGNATGAAYRVLVKAGTYPRANSFTSTSGTVNPTQSVYFKSFGGQVTAGVFDDLTWAIDGTHTNTYSANRSTVRRVFDLINTDENGDYIELLYVADAATCNSTPGSWAQVGSTLYVRRKDGAAVTNSNTRAFIGTASPKFSTNGKTVYLNGFNIQGGSQHALRGSDAPTSKIIAVNSSFKYNGYSAQLYDAVQILDIALFVGVNCVAAKAAKDGFNFHAANGYIPDAVLINCTGRTNGVSPSQSNNGFTCHDAVKAISVMCNWHGNFGANSGHVTGAQVWSVGDIASGSRGDTIYGGSQGPRDFWMDDGQMWLDTCSSMTSGYSILASSNAVIKKRAFVGFVEGQTTGGTITEY